MADAPILELELWSASRKQKAEILRRADGVYQVILSREFFENSPYGPYTYWSETNREAILTDSLERARKLAEEELRLLVATDSEGRISFGSHEE